MPDNADTQHQELPSWIVEIKSTSRQAVTKSRELLGKPAPDTFLGRRQRDITPAPDGKTKGTSVWRPPSSFQ